MTDLYKETIQICGAAFVCGPITWPLASSLIARQQGNFQYYFLKSCKEIGIVASYSGCLPYSSYKLFGIGVQRGVQTPILLTYRDDQRFNNIALYAFSGICSGIIGGIIVTPIEQFKISLANKNFSNYTDANKFFMSHKNGRKGLFVGTKITVLRNVVFDSINAVMYNTLLHSSYINTKNTLHMATLNGFAGVLSAVIDYPLDVLKTRVQSTMFEHYSTNSVNSSSISSIKIAHAMVTKEGFASLYNGLKHKLGLYFMVWFVYGSAFNVIGKCI